MNANASAAFFTNLRDTNNNVKSMRASRVGSAGSQDKENEKNFSVASDVVDKKMEKGVSKLRRPMTASAILKSKCSADLSPSVLRVEDLDLNKDVSDEMVSDQQISMSDLETELRNSVIDFEEVLKIKISTKGTTLADKAKRLESQKDLIIKLREALQELLAKREFFIQKAKIIQQELAEATTKGEEEVRDLAAKLAHAQGDAKSRADEVTRLDEELRQAHARLAVAVAEKDALEARVLELQAEINEDRKALEKEKLEVHNIKTQRDQLEKEGSEFRQKTEVKQAALNNDLQEIRQQLGQEMVARNEWERKFLAGSEEINHLKSCVVASEELKKKSEAEVAKLEAEKSALMSETERDKEGLMNQLAALRSDAEKEKAALSREVEGLKERVEEGKAKEVDMQSRMDTKEAQHNDTVRSLISSQEMQFKRIAELVEEKDAVSNEIRMLKKEHEQTNEELVLERKMVQQLKLDMHLVDKELEAAKQGSESAREELDATKKALLEMTELKHEVQQKLVVTEAEYKVYKETNKMAGAQMEQLEHFFKLQVESHAVIAAQSATEGDLLVERQRNEALKKQNEELNKKLLMAEAARRKLHNEVQELKGNVRTFMRLRPSSRRESEEVLDMNTCPVDVNESDGSVVCNGNSFKFDRAFGQDTRQEDVFEEVRDFVQSALDGYSVSLLAYGQTGAGKTHTMIGGDGLHRGLIPRSLEFILKTVGEMRKDKWTHTLQACCVEIYNESIRDLLIDPTENASKNFRIVQGEFGMMNVTDLELVSVESMEDIVKLMKMAERHRTVKGTDMNERSSRSHTMFQLRIMGERTLANGSKQVLYGSLNLVDLAGSERLDKSGATGDRLKETQAINKSLSALGDVFTAISKKQSHIPFRNSKLTHLLQPSLSGDGKALVLIAVSSAESSTHESLCSLRFSTLVSQCELGKPVKHIVSENSGSTAVAQQVPSSSGKVDTLVKRPLTAPLQGKQQDLKKARNS